MRAFLIAVILLASADASAAPSAEAIVSFNEGKRLLKQHDTDEAIAKLQQAVKLSPDYGEAWTELGNAYLEKESFQEAVKAFGTALDKKPDQTVARYNLAFSLRKIGQPRMAADQYRLYLQANPNDADAHYGLAEALRAAGDKAAAAEAYEAYARSEKNPAQQKWVDKAKQTAAKLRAEAQAEAPKPPPKKEVAAAPPPPKAAPKAETKASQGGLHLSFSENAPPPPATQEEKKVEVAAAKPPKKSARPDSFRTGLKELQDGRYEDALPRLTAADHEMPDDPLILAALASAHLGLEHGEQAEAIYQQAIAKASDDALPGLYLGLGEARRLLGKNDLARDAYNKALQHQRASTSIKRFTQERIAALQ